MQKWLKSIANPLVLIAAVWAIGVSLYIFFSPVDIHSVTATNIAGDSQVVEESTTVSTWYRVQGLWGSTLLLIFAGIFVLAVFLAQRKNYRSLVLLSGFILILCYISGLSIGMLYFPAALILVFAALVLVFT
jgi:hypothetical protein